MTADLKKQIEKAFRPNFTILNGQIQIAKDVDGYELWTDAHHPIISITGIHLHTNKLQSHIKDPKSMRPEDAFFVYYTPGLNYEELLMNRGKQVQIHIQEVDSTSRRMVETKIVYLAK